MVFGSGTLRPAAFLGFHERCRIIAHAFRGRIIAPHHGHGKFASALERRIRGTTEGRVQLRLNSQESVGAIGGRRRSGNLPLKIAPHDWNALVDRIEKRLGGVERIDRYRPGIVVGRLRRWTCSISPNRVGGEALVHIAVILQAHADGHQIVRAVRATRRLACRFHGRDQERNENDNHSEHNTQLRHCEAIPTPHRSALVRKHLRKVRHLFSPLPVRADASAIAFRLVLHTRNCMWGAQQAIDFLAALAFREMVRHCRLAYSSWPRSCSRYPARSSGYDRRQRRR